MHETTCKKVSSDFVRRIPLTESTDSLFLSFVHCALIRENTLSTLALCPGMLKKNSQIFSSSEKQLSLAQL